MIDGSVGFKTHLLKFVRPLESCISFLKIVVANLHYCVLIQLDLSQFTI